MKSNHFDKMPVCDICSTLEETASIADFEVLKDLIYLHSDPVCELLVFCSGCCGVIRQTARFVRTVREVCVKRTESSVKSEPLDGLICDVWQDDPSVDTDEEKPLHLLKLEKSDVRKDTCKENASVKQKFKKKKKKRKKETKMTSFNNVIEDGKLIEYNEDGSADTGKPKKEGRRVVETQEYVVIRLTAAQVREEMASRAESERYKQHPYKCDECVKGFNYPDVLSTHQEKHNESNGPFKCEICAQYCPTTISMRGHMKSHLTRYSCKTCGVVKSSRQHVLEHAASHRPTALHYTCEQCGYTCTRRTALQKHLRSHKPPQHLTCHLCGNKFKSIETLRVHSLKHMPIGAASVRRARPRAVRNDYCVECDKSVASLRRHLTKNRRHSPGSGHGCAECGRTLRSAAALAAHAAWAHGGARPFRCECGRCFGTRDGLRGHARSHRAVAHTHAQRHACAYCETTFKTRAVLKKHVRIHTGERPYECAECGQKFTQSGTRTTHIRLVHRKLPRKVRANGCEETSFEKSAELATKDKRDKSEEAAY